MNKLICCVLLLMVFWLPVQADEVLWKSGLSLYIKYAELSDAKQGGFNAHPITLDAQQLTQALSVMELVDKGLFKKDKVISVFAPSQARLLGKYLSEGLAKAKPNQDIVFALERTSVSGFGILRESTFMAGRVFYANGRLNIIIGDYEKPHNVGQERVAGSAGITEIQYYFNQGSRNKPSGFKYLLLGTDGVSTHRDESDRRRPDWLLIDVPVAAAVYVAENAEENPAQLNVELLQFEAEKIARERRAMRLEMAKLRKEITRTPQHTANTIEQRLRKLDELKDKQLISEDEYNAKRAEILDDI